MIFTAASMLGALGSALRPKNSQPATPATPGQSPEFAELLSKAQRGEITSGAPVKIAKGLQLKLSDEQVGRLSVAADKAEAQGANRALVVMDGQTLQMDVASRTITGAVDTSAPGVIAGVDAIVVAPPPAASNASIVKPPSANAAALANPSLLKSLGTPQNQVTLASSN